MIDATDDATLTSETDLFHEEAARARRYASAMTDKTVSERLNQIAAIYDELAAGQDPSPTDRD